MNWGPGSYLEVLFCGRYIVDPVILGPYSVPPDFLATPVLCSGSLWPQIHPKQVLFIYFTPQVDFGCLQRPILGALQTLLLTRLP